MPSGLGSRSKKERGTHRQLLLAPVELLPLRVGVVDVAPALLLDLVEHVADVLQLALVNAILERAARAVERLRGREEKVRNVRAGRREGRAGTHLKLLELLLLLLELVEALLDVVEQVLDLVALRVCRRNGIDEVSAGLLRRREQERGRVRRTGLVHDLVRLCAPLLVHLGARDLLKEREAVDVLLVREERDLRAGRPGASASDSLARPRDPPRGGHRDAHDLEARCSTGWTSRSRPTRGAT